VTPGARILTDPEGVFSLANMRTRPSWLLQVTVLVVASFVAAACGKLKPADGDGPLTPGAGGSGVGGAVGAAGAGAGAGGSTRVTVTISGTAAPHPLDAALTATADFSMLRVAIVDPMAILLDPTAPDLSAMALDTSATNCDTMMNCAWTLQGVDITNLKLGLVGTLTDTRTGDAREWVKTGTGMGTAADLAAVRAAPAPITMRRAFAVSRKLEGVLGAFAGKALTTTFNPGDLETRGFLIGHVVGKLSEGTPPIAGATVAATGDFKIIYPNDDFSGVGTATASQGLFLMVPNTATSVVATWTVTPPATETRTWNQYLAGANPGNAFIIIMAANE
jgi:hypothetical protein